MSFYTHHLVWISRATAGALAGLNVIRDYPCFDDRGTRAHLASLKADAETINVHLIKIERQGNASI